MQRAGVARVGKIEVALQIEGDGVTSAGGLVDERRCAVYVALRAVTSDRENGAIDNDTQPVVSAVHHEHVIRDRVHCHQRGSVEHSIRASPVGEPSSTVPDEGGDNTG